MVKAGYKQTEVGVIPENWDVRRLDSLGAGSTPPIKAGPFGSSLTKDTYVPFGYKVYGQEQVIRGDYLYGDYFITPKKYRELESCAVRSGDVLLSLVGTVGRLLSIPDGAPPGVINPRLIRFTFDKNRVCSHFFKFLFESEQLQELLERQSQGGTMGVLNAGLLRPFCIQLPPLPEQRAIAEALSDVDGLIESLEKLIAKKRDLKQGVMQELLTGKKRLSGFHGEWESKRLGGVLTVRHGKSQHGITAPDGMYPILASGGEIGRTNVYVYNKPSVLIGRKGTIDSPQYVDSPFWTVDTLFFTEISSEADAKFVFYKFMMICWRSYNEASGVPSLNAKTIENIEVTMPPIKVEQTAIASALSDMDAEIQGLETKLTKTRLLKQGMMQELLTGRIRLI